MSCLRPAHLDKHALHVERVVAAVVAVVVVVGVVAPSATVMTTAAKLRPCALFGATSCVEGVNCVKLQCVATTYL